MTDKDEEDIGAQVSSRLEELFGEEDEDEFTGQQAGAPREDVQDRGSAGKMHDESQFDDHDSESGDQDSPLKNLKALVFGIDWEITDEGMKDFLQEIRDLQERYQHDKVLSTFLKLHESVGKYIRAKKSGAHPEAFKFVASVFRSFEKVLTSPEMKDSRKKRLLSEEITNFKNFKEKLAAAQGRNSPAEPAAESQLSVDPQPDSGFEQHQPQPEGAPEEATQGEEKRTASVLENQEAVDYIVAELKKTIKAEFHTIRQIIKNLGA